MVWSSFEKPHNYDQIFALYEESFVKDNICMFSAEIKLEQDNDGHDDESDNEGGGVSYYSKKAKKPDASRGATLKKSIFANLDGFKSERELDEKKYASKSYCVDSSFLMNQLNKKRSPILMAYPGAVVLPLREPVFTREEDIAANACDFASLYPNTMILWNICKSTAAFNPNFAILIDGELHDPLDDSKFILAAIPFEFNKQYLSVCVILAKATFKKSALTEFILSIVALRKDAKKEQKIALLVGDMITYLRLDNKQKKLKLVINTTYGTMFTKSFTIFQPYLCSAVTYYGRTALLQFALTVYYYYVKNGIDASSMKRGPIAGDTDSLFIKSTPQEIKEILKMYESWPALRGVYSIEHEKIVDDIIFFARKRYVFHFRAESRLTSKGTFVKKQSAGCKSFLYYFLLHLFSTYLAQKQIELFRSGLRSMLNALKEESKKHMYHSFALSKDLANYTNPSCLHLQLKHLETLTGKAYVAGTVIKYAHYPFVFIPGEFYGPVDQTNRGQSAFLRAHHNATALVEDLEPYYEGLGMEKSIVRGIELDLKATLVSIFDGVAQKEGGHSTLQQIFWEEFEQVFGMTFYSNHTISQRSPTKRKLTASEKKLIDSGVSACNQSILNFFAKRTKY